jgi:hypothetical protein
MFRLSLILSLLVLTASACKKHDHDHDHADLNGFRLSQSGTVVAQQTGTTLTGSVTIARGTANPVFSVVFLEEDGKVYDDFKTDESLLIVVGSASVAAVQAGPGRWEFRLNGVAQGATTLTVNLMHSGHKDFESRPVPVTVTP